jgi:RAQPRD family integrative conjugative element protein
MATTGLAQPVFAANAVSENAALAVVIRQLDMVDRLADRCASLRPARLAPAPFDYAGLHADVARLRQTIHDYLFPLRAPANDLDDWIGDYLRETGALPMRTRP